MRNGCLTLMMCYTDMNILVTGANGQLGHEMQRVALQSNNNYLFTDVEELDITDYNAVISFMSKEKINVVVNCAAYTNVDKAEDDEVTAFRINAKAVENLANACKCNNATLIHVSTDYVFNGDANIPYKEDVNTNPTGAYGRTKLAGEECIINVDCNYIILRTAWLYSKWGNNFVKTMMRLTAEKESLNVIFDQVGTPTFAGDLADAISHIIENNLIDKKGIYHFSNEGVCSWFDFATVIADFAGNKCYIKPIHSDEFPSKVKRPHFSVLDKSKFTTTFNYIIPYWMVSLKKCMLTINN